MKRILTGALVALLPGACGFPVDAFLTTFGTARPQIPLRFRVLCSPIFRDVDIHAIVIEINAGIDENASRVDAIEAADEVCQSNADELLSIGEASDEVAFDDLDAAAYKADCVNCYIAIIDALYDQ